MRRYRLRHSPKTHNGQTVRFIQGLDATIKKDHGAPKTKE